MIDESALISVLVIGQWGAVHRSTVMECFMAQMWKHKEIIIAEDLAGAVAKAKGLYCSLWSTGYHYHSNTLSMLAAQAEPNRLVEIRVKDDQQACCLFFRRAAHLFGSPQLKVTRVAAGGIVDQQARKKPLKSAVFYHSGNLGDIIYSLAFVRAMGGGKIILGPEMELPRIPVMRQRMNAQLMENLYALLMAQPYVAFVEYTNYMPPCDYDMNRFRLHPKGNLVEQLFTAFNICKEVYLSDTEPWLSMPAHPVKPVVFNRTLRWRNPQFDWKRVVDTYRGMSVFVGFEEEYEAFCLEVGERVPYRRTPNLYELARVIAGCSLFIGNQSTAYAIAEGLKKDTVQETCPDIPNCKFVRPNAIYGEGPFLYLPNAKSVLANGRSLRSSAARMFQNLGAGLHRLLDRDYDTGTRSLNALVDDLSRTNEYLSGIAKENHPSVLEQTPWPCGFFEFPASSYVYYNPSLVQFKGDRWLLTRRALPQADNTEFSDVVVWKLNGQLALNEMVKPQLPSRFTREQWEDARAIPVGDKLLVNCCNYVQGKQFAGHQHLVLLNQDWASVDSWEPVYMRNAPMQQATKPEKNWVFFEHDGMVHLVYSVFPHRVVQMPWKQVGREYLTKKLNVLWRHGEPRGGTPPVRVGDEYFSFFHSATFWRVRSRKYHAGVYAFSAEPPFEITRMSVMPLLNGSESDPVRAHLPLCVFPAGAFFENGIWTVALGVNDCRSAWMRIPHAELLQTLRVL